MTQNRWNDSVAKSLKTPLDERVYTSQLLGQDPTLVLHGGGNTSVKGTHTNLFGETESVIWVKGSGWDLATIQAKGFSAVRMQPLLRAFELNEMGDEEMMNFLRCNLVDAKAPDPSVETLLHAALPHRFVDHTHANAVLTLTNQPDSLPTVTKLFGDKIAIIPYVMPGFLLAKHCAETFKKNPNVEGLLLWKHGLFTFGETAKESYDRMIHYVQLAEKHIESQKKPKSFTTFSIAEEKASRWCSALRREFSKRGLDCVFEVDRSAEAMLFLSHPDAESFTQRGPLTPDHVIRTKSLPLWISRASVEKDSLDSIPAFFDSYEKNYQAYFERGQALIKTPKTRLDPLPRVVLVPGVGIVAVGKTEKDAKIASDIYRHTAASILNAEALSRYEALPEKDLFEMEYWVLEQNKLKLSPKTLPLSGKVCVVTGGSNGVGLGIAKELESQGALVYSLDLNDRGLEASRKTSSLKTRFLSCDVSQDESVQQALQNVVLATGGVDAVIINAGIFPATQNIESISSSEWKKTVDVNLNGCLSTLRHAMSWLKHQGKGGDIVLIASKNVPAPGKEWGAYSASKAAQVQLARVAALEGAADGIRVNILHPHLIWDTSLWTEETLQKRASAYGMTVEQYKKNNLLKVSLESADVGKAVFALISGFFNKTTGAQIAIDGGSDRTL